MRLIGLLAASAAACALLVAQSTLGTLRGTVRDTTGAVVQRAAVRVRHVGQNTTTVTQTNDIGDYEVHNLNLGEYEVTVEAAGFKKFVHGGTELNARQVQRVDARLEVGTAQAEVTVTAGTPAISTETSTIDSARTQRDILGLPVAFRAGNTSLINFIALAPGVQIRGSSQANFSISGSRQSQNEISVDGISTLGMRNHDVLVDTFPSAESVREIRITSVASGAEFQGSANVDTISKSGENKFHGSLFEYLQNGAFDARNFFSTAIPFKVANTYGGSLGGPLVLPGYNGRNRTFFFIDYEANRNTAKAVLTPTVPSLALRRGDFSQVAASPCAI